MGLGAPLSRLWCSHEKGSQASRISRVCKLWSLMPSMRYSWISWQASGSRRLQTQARRPLYGDYLASMGLVGPNYRLWIKRWQEPLRRHTNTAATSAACCAWTHKPLDTRTLLRVTAPSQWIKGLSQGTGNPRSAQGCRQSAARSAQGQETECTHRGSRVDSDMEGARGSERETH